MSIGPSLLPLVTGQGLAAPSQAGSELEPALELDLSSLHQQLDQELNGEGTLPVEVVEQLVGLFRSVDGEALPDELQAVLQKLQAVAEAGAQSPLLDPVAGGLGEQPRIEVAALLSAPSNPDGAPRDEGLASTLAELAHLGPSLELDERMPRLDPAVRRAPTTDDSLQGKAEVFPTDVESTGLVELRPLAAAADDLPAQQAAVAVSRVVAVESPASLAEPLPPAPLQAGAPTPPPAEPVTSPVVQSESAVALSPVVLSPMVLPPAVQSSVVQPIPPAVTPAALPVRGGAAKSSAPSTFAAPASVQDGGGTLLLDSVEVVSRSTAKATTAVAPSATARPVGSGTFDGTPWLMTASPSRAAAPPLAAPGVESVDPDQLPEPAQHRPAPTTRSSAQDIDVTRTLRSPSTPAGQVTLAPDGALQAVAGDASPAQSTDITRPALVASRGPALSSQLAQAAQSSAPDAPVTLAERPLQRVAVRVRDGERSMRLGVVRESEGYAVEVRASRDVVTEIRDMEADVDAALREDGDDGLASFDAFADDEPLEGSDFFDEEVESEPVEPSEEEPYHDSSRLLDRRA